MNKAKQDRFWEGVEIKTGNECWPWKRCKTRFGYGRFRMGGTHMLAHRLAYQLTKGTITPGMNVLHNCDNPSCVNPAHLKEGTQADNLADMRERGRMAPASATRHLGEDHGVSKLTNTAVKQIRKLYRKGSWQFGQRGLGRKFGVHMATINRVLTGKTWAHVPQ